VRKEFDSQTSVGAIATGVVRGGGEPSAFAGGFDYRIRFARALAPLGPGHRHPRRTDRPGMGAGFDLRRSGKNVSLDSATSTC
jgi:hypothetical protein